MILASKNTWLPNSTSQRCLFVLCAGHEGRIIAHMKSYFKVSAKMRTSVTRCQSCTCAATVWGRIVPRGVNVDNPAKVHPSVTRRDLRQAYRRRANADIVVHPLWLGWTRE